VVVLTELVRNVRKRATCIAVGRIPLTVGRMPLIECLYPAMNM
jgi:hypothetical protein